MKSVNINGVLLSEEALEELHFYQTGSFPDDLKEPDDSGLSVHLEAVDKVISFLIERKDNLDEEPVVILNMLCDLNGFRNSLKRFRVPQKTEKA